MRSGGETYRKRTETTIVKDCLGYLQLLENQGMIAWCDRLNSGKVFTGFRCQHCGKLNMGRLIKLCRKGTADIYFLTHGIPGFFVFVEVKKDKNIQSKEQIKFQSMVESAGHKYWLVYDVNELMIRTKALLESV